MRNCLDQIDDDPVLFTFLLQLAQEILRPDVFWYDAAVKVDLPFNIVGLVLFQLVTMHWVETKVRTFLN
jgi:hypothetical protein